MRTTTAAVALASPLAGAVAGALLLALPALAQTPAPTPPAPLAPAATPTPPAAPLSWTLDVRLRGEAFSTPSPSPALDATYTLGLARVRAGVDARWRAFTFHGAVQGAAMTGVPDDGAFAAGPVYFAANGNDTSPDGAGLLELFARWEGHGWTATVGRQPYSDGLETLTGVPYLDMVKRTRLAERLVGNWEWPNVGRRFDGVSAGGRAGAVHLAGFALRPLAGGVDHDDGLEPLSDLGVWGVTTTLPYGRPFSHVELRLFTIGYDDERRGARVAAGGPIELQTTGASFLLGGEKRDLLVWAVHQDGDWGASDHQAWAALVDVGERYDAWPGKPVLRFGAAVASGDPSPGGTHRAFFNLLPTKHKYYGSLDYGALANLRTVFMDGRWQLAHGWQVALGLHHFRLDERRDAWYGGSGAFDADRLGYQARTLPGGFPSQHVGDEVDLEASRPLPGGLTLSLGGGWFRGGDAAAALLRDDEDGAWAFVQLGWRRQHPLDWRSGRAAAP